MFVYISLLYLCFLYIYIKKKVIVELREMRIDVTVYVRLNSNIITTAFEIRVLLKTDIKTKSFLKVFGTVFFF